MFIKQLTVCGYRSYSSATAIPLTPTGINVIIGQNGSGKSNLLNAIEFVMGFEELDLMEKEMAPSRGHGGVRKDNVLKIKTLTEQQRKAMLYECDSKVQRTMEAWVEIVFDNSDQRIQRKKNIVTIRRVISNQRDQWFLDGEPQTLMDINCLFELAGLSQCNMYNIVRQGKITQLATSSDVFRLNVLRELAGERTFRTKKAQMMAELEPVNLRMKEFDIAFEAFRKKQDSLYEQNDRLKEFLKLDKQRRAIEYTISLKELNSAKEKRLLREREKRKAEEESDSQKAKWEELKEILNDKENKLKDLRNRIVERNSMWSELMEKQKYYINARTRMDVTRDQLMEEKNSLQNVRQETDEKLRELERLIGLEKAKLAEKVSESSKIAGKEEETRSKLSKYNARRELMEWKMNFRARRLKIGSKYVKDMTNSVNMDIEKMEKNITDIESQIKKIHSEKKQLQEKLKELEEEEKKIKSGNSNENRSLLNKTLSELNETFLENKVKDRRLTDEDQKLRDGLSETENDLASCAGKNTVVSIKSVEQVLGMATADDSSRRKNADWLVGYYGPLIDNFKCDKPIFHPIIEQTVGFKQLFSHLVENANVSSKILNAINNQHMRGEINFIACNRISVSKIEYPNMMKDGKPVAEPLINFLRYDDKFDAVMKLLFGKIIICRSLNIAIELAKNVSMNKTFKGKFEFVTLDGDKISSAGPMTGGYLDKNKKSIFDYHSEYKRFINEHKELVQKKKLFEKESNEVSCKLSKIKDELQQFDEKKNSCNLEEVIESKNKIKRVDLPGKEKEMNELVVKLKTSKEELKKLNARRDLLESEKGNKLEKLTDEEMKTWSKLSKEEVELEKQLVVRFANKKFELEKQINWLSSNLEENLEFRLEDEKNCILKLEIDMKELDEKVKGTQLEKARIEKEIANLEPKIKEQRKKLDNLEDYAKNIDAEYASALLEEREQMDQFMNAAKIVEKIAGRLKNCENLIMKYNRSLSEIGTLPQMEEDLDKLSLTRLYKDLKKMKSKIEVIEKNGPVNHTTLVEFRQNEKRMKVLEQRKNQSESDFTCVKDAIQTIEMQAVEKLETSYKAVSINFSSIFKEFFPKGEGKLSMVRSFRNGGATGSDVSGSQHSQASSLISSNAISDRLDILHSSSLDLYQGVSINVSFNSNQSELRDLQLLSGGQKTIVALCFIFAIQKADPAPFYLFDEVDAALDQDYRAMVAAKIKQLSLHSQFICTTFSREFIDCADRYFGVFNVNKASKVERLNYEKALRFFAKARSVAAKKTQRVSVEEDNEHQSHQHEDVRHESVVTSHQPQREIFKVPPIRQPQEAGEGDSPVVRRFSKKVKTVTTTITRASDDDDG